MLQEPISPTRELPWMLVFQRQLEASLTAYVTHARWFRSKTRAVTGVRLLDSIPLTDRAVLSIAEVSLEGAPSERYVLPLTVLGGEAAQVLQRERPALVLHRFGTGEVLADALGDPEALAVLADALDSGGELRGSRSRLRFEHLHSRAGAIGGQPGRLLSGEQSNSSIVFDHSHILKVFRRLDRGESTDLEIGRTLTALGFTGTAPLAGAIAWQPEVGDASTLGLLQGFLENDGEGWTRTLDRLAGFLQHQRSPPGEALTGWPEPGAAQRAVVLGRRTAELHEALSQGAGEPFRPEPFSLNDQQEALEKVEAELGPLWQLLNERFAERPQVQAMHARVDELRSHLEAFRLAPVGGQRIRIHGDLHLGQLLELPASSGDVGDVAFIDFEGEPARTLSERRAKRSPLVDVAGLLRSFHYAAVSAAAAASDSQVAGAWTGLWHSTMNRAFLDSYFGRLGASALLPKPELRGQALDFFLLEKCLDELTYELNNRPEWVGVPLAGLETLLNSPSASR